MEPHLASRSEFDRALAPVLQDLQAEPVPALTIQPDTTGQAQAWLVDATGARTGLRLESTIEGLDAVIWVAETVQEAAIEALWAASLPAVWPNCPRHPGTHPLAPAAIAGTAKWRCPADDVAVAGLGSLER